MAIRKSRKGTKKKPLESKLTILDMELAITDYKRGVFPMSRYDIVPNISSGLSIHECDLLAVSKSKWATEIEIKTSKRDTKKDLEKKHKHNSNKIKQLYFALPVEAQNDKEWLSYVPDRAGIIIVKHWQYGVYDCVVIRKPKRNKDSRKLTSNEYIKFLRLGTLRIWSLKNKIKKLNGGV